MDCHRCPHSEKRGNPLRNERSSSATTSSGFRPSKPRYRPEDSCAPRRGKAPAETFGPLVRWSRELPGRPRAAGRRRPSGPLVF